MPHFLYFLSVFTDSLCECLKGKNLALVISVSAVPNTKTDGDCLVNICTSFNKYPPRYSDV